MGKEFISNDHSNVDFSFVYDLDEEALDIFFSVTDLSIEAMKEALEEDVLRNSQYLRGLTSEQLMEMLTYYKKLLDLYTDYEFYEECEPLLSILNALEAFFISEQELVVNMKEKP